MKTSLKEKILTIHSQISEFQNSENMSMEFHVDCDLEDRLKFIYAAIFPGTKKMQFYFRFFLSRIAYFTDYSPLKVLIYRICGVKIGKGVFISPQVFIDVHFPSFLIIEDYAILGINSYIFQHDFINNKYRIGKVKIKRGALVGAFAK